MKIIKEEGNKEEDRLLLSIFYLSSTPDKDHVSEALMFLAVLYVSLDMGVHFSRAVLYSAEHFNRTVHYSLLRTKN